MPRPYLINKTKTKNKNKKQKQNKTKQKQNKTKQNNQANKQTKTLVKMFNKNPSENISTIPFSEKLFLPILYARSDISQFSWAC